QSRISDFGSRIWDKGINRIDRMKRMNRIRARGTTGTAPRRDILSIRFILSILLMPLSEIWHPKSLRLRGDALDAAAVLAKVGQLVQRLQIRLRARLDDVQRGAAADEDVPLVAQPHRHLREGVGAARDGADH